MYNMDQLAINDNPIMVPYAIGTVRHLLHFIKYKLCNYYDSSYTVWIVSSTDSKTWSNKYAVVSSSINSQSPPFICME